MKIAFATTWDPRNPGLWAGTGYHIAKALERQGCSIQFLGPLRDRHALVFKGLGVLSRKLLRQELQRDREPAVLDGYAEQISQRLKGSDAQLVFSVGGIAIARLATTLPIVFWADATYPAIVDEYRWNLPPSRRSRRLGMEMERSALARASLAIFSSEWAAESAIRDCGADPAKVRVVPFGANVETQRTGEQVEALIARRPADRCRLLFVGTGWERKGGDVAVDVARRLNESGLPTELTIAGPLPPADVLPPYVEPLGFLDKRTPEGRARFDEVFGTSHFLLLPARAEAFGVVLCEAGSFGVPALATRVGGIPTIVRDEANGRLFSPDDAEAMAAAVRELFGDFDRYRALCRSSFAEYNARLNWEVAGRRVKRMLDQLLAARDESR